MNDEEFAAMIMGGKKSSAEKKSAPRRAKKRIALPVVRKKKKKKKKKKRPAKTCGSPTGKPAPVVLVAKRGSRVGKAKRSKRNVTAPKACKTRPVPKRGRESSENVFPKCQDRPLQRKAWERGRIPNAHPAPYRPGKQKTHGTGATGQPSGSGMPDIDWFVGRKAGVKAGKIVIAFSGGKDSLACLLYTIELCLDLGLNPSEVIECWHYSVDGRPWFYDGSTGENEWDWPVTEDYCRQICACLEINLYFGWRMGGLMGEVLKGGKDDDPLTGLWEKALPGGGPRPVPPMIMEIPEGDGVVLRKSGGVAGKHHIRRGFPAKGASLTTRWCSGYVKIDVGRSMISNRKDLRGKRTILITGERGEESKNRANYAVRQFESGHGERSRHIEQWRPILHWCEIDVWAIIARWGIRPHPAYRLGWGRLSCMTCIFGSNEMWASVRALDPDRFNRFAQVEKALVREKAELLAMLSSMTPAQVKKAAIENAMGTIDRQFGAGNLTAKQATKLRKVARETSGSGKLAEDYRNSITGRIPQIDRDESLLTRTKPRWRKGKQKTEQKLYRELKAKGLLRDFPMKVRETGQTKSGLAYIEVFDPATPFPQAKPGSKLAGIALSHRWAESPFMNPWELPAGAFGEASGPS